MATIGLYGPHNMLDLTAKLYKNIKIYSVTPEDLPPEQLNVFKHEVLRTTIPPELVGTLHATYDRDRSIDKLTTMMRADDIASPILRTFNAVTDEYELVSEYYVKTPSGTFHLSQLKNFVRKILFTALFGNVYDADLYFQKMNLNTSDDEVIFSVSSCITSKIANDSVYSTQERFDMTIEQANSIRRICKKSNTPCKIFLLESSALSLRQIHKLSQVFDQVWLFDKDEVNNNLSSSNKTLGESYVQLSLLSRLTNFKLFIKFGGRYKFLDRFDMSYFDGTLPTFRYTPANYTWSKHAAFDGVCYSIPKSYHQGLIDVLFQVISVGPFIDIEHSLYQYLCGGTSNLNKFAIRTQVNAIGFMAKGLLNYI